MRIDLGELLKSHPLAGDSAKHRQRRAQDARGSRGRVPTTSVSSVHASRIAGRVMLCFSTSGSKAAATLATVSGVRECRSSASNCSALVSTLSSDVTQMSEEGSDFCKLNCMGLVAHWFQLRCLCCILFMSALMVSLTGLRTRSLPNYCAAWPMPQKAQRRAA